MANKKKYQDKTREELIHELEELHKKNSKLEENKNLYKTLTETLTDGITLTDLKGKYIYCNQKQADLLGYDKAADLIGVDGFQFIAPEHQEKTAETLQQIFDKKHIEGIIYDIIRKDGTRITAEFSVQIINNEKESPQSLLCLMRDITERKRAENALQESEQKRRRAMELACAGTWEWEIKTNQVFWSDEAYRIFDLEIGTPITYETVKERVHPDDREYHDQNTASWLENQGGDHYEYRIVHTDESIHYILGFGEVICDATGEPEWMLGFVQDITELKKAEEALHESEERYRSFVHNFNGIAFRGEIGLKVVFFHGAVEKITGYKSEDFMREKPSWGQIIHPDDVLCYQERAKEAMSDPTHSAEIEHRIICKDGNVRWIHQIAKVIFDELGKPIYIEGILYDITERKLAEETLKNNQNFLNSIIEQSPFATWISDEKGTIIKCNVALTKLLNISEDQLIGKYNVFEDKIAIEQGLMPKIRTVFEDGKTANFSIEWDAKEIGYKDSKKVHIEGTMFPIHDDKGNLTNVVDHWVDVSKRKQAEKEKMKLKEQLQQAQKMEAIGTLAGGIAHDFNNILGVIMGYTDLTLDDLSDTKNVIKNLQHVMKASERAKEMVQQILAFSRKDEQTMKSVSIGKIVKEVVNFLRTSIPTTIEIRFEKESGLPLIFGNKTQINQVLMNLCTNSAYAMKENGGLLNIELKEVMLEADDTESLKMKPGVYQVINVSDTGTGINKDIIDKIFEPYFTTKDTGEGTGMGLAVIYGIIKNHGGDIKVYSEPGKGTVFNVYFPVPDSGIIEKSTSTDSDQPEVMGNNENILFVDDEVSLVEMGTQMITNLGYQVQSRTSSIEALEAFKADPDKYDLVITDMTMPNMTGVKLAEKIHKVRADIPVILCTGFSNGINKNNYKAQGISALIMKPVIKRELAEAIKEALDKRSDIK